MTEQVVGSQIKISGGTATCIKKIEGFDLYRVGKSYDFTANMTNVTVGGKGIGYHPLPQPLFNEHFEITPPKK